MIRSLLCGLTILTMVGAARADDGAPTVVAPDTAPAHSHSTARPHRRHMVPHEEIKPKHPIGILLSGGDMAIWQKSNDGRTYETYQRYSFCAGYSFHGLFDIFGEYGFYSANSDSGGNVSLHYHHDEYLVWIRKIFFDQKFAAPYVAAGIGAQQEVVTTTLASESTRNTGSLQALGALAAGYRFGTLIQLTIEGRLSFSAGMNPNPEPGLGVQLGTRF